MQGETLLTTQLRTAHSPLRIAFVTETYPPEVNGVANTAARFIEGMRSRGHVIHLVRPRQHPDDRGHTTENYSEMLVRGCPIPRYPQLRMGLPAKRELVTAWKNDRPDVVHIVTEGPLGWSALRAARKLGLPTTSDFRTNFHTYSRHYGVGWLCKIIEGYLRTFHNRTQLTLAPTESLRDQLATLGFNNVRVVARGVDTGLFNPARRSEALRTSWGAAPQDTVLLYVGRLAPEKNLDPVVMTFEEARRKAPATKLVFVGDGPARDELRARCPDAIFAGMRRGEDLASHYASGDMFVFPSLTETFGNVTVEAMASGLAVVAYDYAAAAAHIARGINGVLAPYDDAVEFVRQAAALAVDRGRIHELGVHARATAAVLAWDRIVEQFENFLRLVAESRLDPVNTGMPNAVTGVGSAHS